MKIVFFVFKEYPGFRGTITEEELKKCSAEVHVVGRGVDLVVVRVDNPYVRQCVERVLEMSDIEYFEMEGAPRVLRFKTPWGATRAEVKFV